MPVLQAVERYAKMSTTHVYSHMGSPTSGLSKDPFLAQWARASFACTIAADVGLVVRHQLGLQLAQANPLSRTHLSEKFQNIVDEVADSRKRAYPAEGMLYMNE